LAYVCGPRDGPRDAGANPGRHPKAEALLQRLLVLVWRGQRRLGCNRHRYRQDVQRCIERPSAYCRTARWLLRTPKHQRKLIVQTDTLYPKWPPKFRPANQPMNMVLGRTSTNTSHHCLRSAKDCFASSQKEHQGLQKMQVCWTVSASKVTVCLASRALSSHKP
jgi:hypothetical protein